MSEVNEAKRKKWDHDIAFIDGQSVEEVVKKFQETGDEVLLKSIIKNYEIFRHLWVKEFSKTIDNDVDGCGVLYDEIIWKSAKKYNAEKALKAKGKAFNAYLISALMNQSKNQKNSKMSHKNHPRVTCPICKKAVYQIDCNHLKHLIDLDEYKKMYHNYPVVSTDGLTICPITGDYIIELTEEYINRAIGYYTVEDFKKEFWYLLPVFPIQCPVTKLKLFSLTNKYPSAIKTDYSIEEFISDFPDFSGIIHCPFSGRKMLEITQEHLDSIFKQKDRKRLNWEEFEKLYPNVTVKAKKVDVINPYSNNSDDKVPELTMDILIAAKTNWKDHNEKYVKLWIDNRHTANIHCPFTGDEYRMITHEYLDGIGRSMHEFYNAVCKFPPKKFQVKCAHCGDWVDNIWDHLNEKKHFYAQTTTIEEFDMSFGNSCPKKAIISTNAFVENDSGDSVHLVDLFRSMNQKRVDFVEIEDSLNHVAKDDIERKIARAVRHSRTLEDVFYSAASKEKIQIDFEFKAGLTKEVREVLKQRGMTDFDLADTPEDGRKEIEVMIPSRETIKKKLTKMIHSSDLIDRS